MQTSLGSESWLEKMASVWKYDMAPVRLRTLKYANGWTTSRCTTTMKINLRACMNQRPSLSVIGTTVCAYVPEESLSIL
jgi:hypothetical protein